jgi:hypothetical protein
LPTIGSRPRQKPSTRREDARRGADAQPESLDAIKAGTQLDTVTHSPYVVAF